MENTLFLRPLLAGVEITLKGWRYQLQTELDTKMLKWLQLLLCLYLVIVEATQELESQPNEQDILENTTSRQSLYETPTKQRSCGCFYHWICLRVCQEPEEEKQDDQTDTKLLARLKRSLNASCSDCHKVDQKEDSKLLTRLKRDVEQTKEAAWSSVMKLFSRLGQDQDDDETTKTGDTNEASSYGKIKWGHFC